MSFVDGYVESLLPKKDKELHFGYKKHVPTDKNGIQLSVHTDSYDMRYHQSDFYV